MTQNYLDDDLGGPTSECVHEWDTGIVILLRRIVAACVITAASIIVAIAAYIVWGA